MLVVGLLLVLLAGPTRQQEQEAQEQVVAKEQEVAVEEDQVVDREQEFVKEQEEEEEQELEEELWQDEVQSSSPPPPPPLLTSENPFEVSDPPLRLEFNVTSQAEPAPEYVDDEEVDGGEEVEEGVVVEIEKEEDVVKELGKPQNLAATNVTAHSMQLQWTMGNTSYNIIRGYRVFYKHDSYADIKTFNGQLPKFTLTGLVPYTQYNVWVRPISSSQPDVVAEASDR